MAKPSFTPLFFILCHILLLHCFAQTQDDEHQPGECPEEFPCGSLGLLRFPLTQSSRPDCGLLRLDCDAKPYPKLQPGGKEAPAYDAKFQDGGSFILLLDPNLRRFLDNKRCQFSRNFSSIRKSFQSTLSITYVRTPVQTLFNCSDNKVVVDGYRSYGCDGFTVHYRDPYTANLGQDKGYKLPPNCSFIQFPAQDEADDVAGERYFTLTSEFYLTWDLTGDCAKCFKESGGRCLTEKETNEFNCLVSRGSPPAKGKRKRNLKIVIITAACVGGVAIFVILVLFYRKKYLIGQIWNLVRTKTYNEQKMEKFLTTYGSLAPKRYSYSEVRKMTESFKNQLGQGGYGCVYKGKMHDGSLVAVKVLKDLKDGHGEEEFINELGSIIRTSHVNVVTLKGFCSDGRKKALIYEFMSNGSLERFIYGNKSFIGRQLEWKVLYRIAIGIARGLEYLHRGCNTRILHFDIKPHNILLDKDFCPKISDFGLAKLCTNKDSIVSVFGARGTVGYIAPEVVCRSIGGISYKSDVYSYGMMVLEMVGGRRNFDGEVSRTSEMYFPYWIHSRLELQDLELHGITKEEDDDECVRKMIVVSLWCIQLDPASRPSMSRVVEMLEGNMSNLEIPPKPYFSSPSRSEVYPTT
ncbi:PREDICTED: rust resistance kinase Lr10-like isoform X2 [Ipomoea nil]|uniref:rust resistance kinase Lr10-like isoform X2 n=1 Tax=Ipomoea nil TaxID=35883 RepID=UPI00090169C7|nr:PREDICTED: rust resistance kinase Lr10-like isoform X2 [Ipomoea nil]